MNIDKFLSDEQDIKAVEKVIVKIHDLIHDNEELLYMAVQKKPAVNLLPDSIVVSTHRLFFCSPTHLGLTLNIKDISWRNIKEVAFKEEFFGSQFICIPQHGDPIIMDYIPKIQARKLHQFASQQMELERKSSADKNNTLNLNFIEDIAEAEIIESPQLETEDEITAKLKKLKLLYDQELITQTEYETKKAEILSNL